MPEATYVRGFKSWIDAGRCVRNGKTGIRILAPRPWQREATVDEAGTLQIEHGVSFAAVPVFNVSQTDPIPGHPHPWEPPQRHAAAGDDAMSWALWGAMSTHADALGLSVSTCPMDGRPNSYGYYHHDTPRRSGSAPIAPAPTWPRPSPMSSPTRLRMMPAPSCRGTSAKWSPSPLLTASARFGLDLSLRSVDYIAGWGHPQGHDPEAFGVGMAAIHDGAASLIDAIEAAMFLPAELEFAAWRNAPPAFPLAGLPLRS